MVDRSDTHNQSISSNLNAQNPQISNAQSKISDGEIVKPQKIPSSNFTNNTEPNTLKNKFSEILDDKSIVNLSFLVGYFRASGFKHLHEILGRNFTRFKSIRILVGIDVDNLVSEMAKNGDDLNFADDKKFRKIFRKTERKHIAAARYDKEVEDSINELKSALEQKNLADSHYKRQKCPCEILYLFTRAKNKQNAAWHAHF